MIHRMKLDPVPFEMIGCGRKTYELRLYDDKRQKIKAGDKIIFTCTSDENRTLEVSVTGLHRFRDFAELYSCLPLLSCGYTENDVSSASPEDMEKYYSPEMQKKYGVVGIEISLDGERKDHAVI